MFINLNTSINIESSYPLKLNFRKESDSLIAYRKKTKTKLFSIIKSPFVNKSSQKQYRLSSYSSVLSLKTSLVNSYSPLLLEWWVTLLLQHKINAVIKTYARFTILSNTF